MTEIDNQVAESNEGQTLREALQEAMENQTKEPEQVAEEEPQEEPKEEVVAESEEVEELPVYKAPSNWNKQEKELFAKLPEEIELENGEVIPVKELLSKYDKSRNADYTKKTQELSTIRKDIEPINELLEPYKDNFQRMGIKPADYLSQLMQFDARYSEDPIGTVKALMEKKGLSAKDLGLTTQESEVDDDDAYLTDEELRIKRLEKELAEAKNGTKKTQEEIDKIRESYNADKDAVAAERMVKEFESATDEDGNLLHKHFDDDRVRKEMYQLWSSGEAKSLEEAYNMSARVELLKLKEGKEQDEEITTRNEVAKAKRAGMRVKTNVTSNYQDLSLRDELKARLSSSRV